MRKNIVSFKEVCLYPTKFRLHVWVCDDRYILAGLFHRYYGATVEYYTENLSKNQVATIDSSSDSVSRGHTVIVMNLSRLDMSVLVHEINHVIYHLGSVCGVEITKSSQEWTSCMMQYIYDSSCNIKEYEKVC